MLDILKYSSEAKTKDHLRSFFGKDNYERFDSLCSDTSDKIINEIEFCENNLRMKQHLIRISYYAAMIKSIEHRKENDFEISQYSFLDDKENVTYLLFIIMIKNAIKEVIESFQILNKIENWKFHD